MSHDEKLANGFTFNQEVSLCELYWPGRLARTASSKARRSLRKSAADRCLISFFKAQGRICGTCVYRSNRYCNLSSDFYGNTIIKASDTCPEHTERTRND
ncbi:hypothetical protein [Rhizobium arsenicireducens]